MKITFNTRTVSLTELSHIRDIIDGLTGSKLANIALSTEETEPTKVTTLKSVEQVDVTNNIFAVEIESTPVSSFIKNYVDAPPPENFVTFENHPHQGFYQSNVPSVSPSPTTSETIGIPQGSSQSVTDEELDSDGKPWDATIHSETRAKNKDGTWRNRRHAKNVEVKAAIPGLESITPNSVPAPPRERGTMRTLVYVDEAQDIVASPRNGRSEPMKLVDSKTNDVLGIVHVPTDATDEEISTIVGQPVKRKDHETIVTDSSPSIVPPPPAATPPVVKTAPQGAPVGTFAELMERVTKHFAAQKITSKDLAEVCSTFGISSIQECYSNQSMIPLVGSAIDEKAVTKVGA